MGRACILVAIRACFQQADFDGDGKPDLGHPGGRNSDEPEGIVLSRATRTFFGGFWETNPNTKKRSEDLSGAELEALF